MNLGRSLLRINKDLKQEPTYPKCCSLASKKVYNSLGFLPYAGYVLTSNGLEAHSWNVDSNGKVLDLTLKQFDNSVKEIIYEKKENLIDSWGYFEDEILTRNLRKYIEVFNK